jgi:hypothetical protein
LIWGLGRVPEMRSVPKIRVKMRAEIRVKMRAR